jgi:hypothetical protein
MDKLGASIFRYRQGREGACCETVMNANESVPGRDYSIWLQHKRGFGRRENIARAD